MVPGMQQLLTKQQIKSGIYLEFNTLILLWYLLAHVQWALHNGNSPQVGINDIDGQYFSVPGALTPNIINVVNTSNVGRPGLWVFQVDTYITAGKASFLVAS